MELLLLLGLGLAAGAAVIVTNDDDDEMVETTGFDLDDDNNLVGTQGNDTLRAVNLDQLESTDGVSMCAVMTGMMSSISMPRWGKKSLLGKHTVSVLP